MGITNPNESNTPLTNIRYSAFLGILYVSNPEVEAKITEVKTAVGGESVVKKGYQGNSGDVASAKATCGMCSSASPSIPSTASTSCCRGTSPQS